MRPRRLAEALLGLAMAYLYQIGALFPSRPPRPEDLAVARLDAAFESTLRASPGLKVSSKGMFFRDRDMLFWWRFADNFGANPNTPYMFNALPLLGFLLPSPIWSLGAHDAVVLLARVPPRCEYYSFTTYAMFLPRHPPLAFASLGDSINHANIKQHEGLFAHVVTANQRTFDLIELALVASGLPASAINLAPVPANLGLLEDVVHLGGQVRLGTYFEVLMRLFRFHNQSEGDAYLHSHPPVYYIKGNHGESGWLAASKAPGYRSRAHPESVDERPLAASFEAHGLATLEGIRRALASAGTLTTLERLPFAPLKIVGLDCLERRTKCLGDGPDAAYFAPNVVDDRDEMGLLRLQTDDELHVITLCHHRQLNAAIYGSVAMVKPSWPAAATLSKDFMRVRGTSLGVTLATPALPPRSSRGCSPGAGRTASASSRHRQWMGALWWMTRRWAATTTSRTASACTSTLRLGSARTGTTCCLLDCITFVSTASATPTCARHTGQRHTHDSLVLVRAEYK